MGTKQVKVKGFEKIQKPLNYNPKYLLDRKGKPNGKKYLIEDKLDGLRGFIFVDIYPKGCEVTSYTSGGVEVPNAKFINYRILMAVGSNNWNKSFVLDGEFICKNWNDSNSAVKTQTYDEQLAKNLGIRVFDIIPLDDWNGKSCDIPLIVRKQWLEKIVKRIASKTIILHSYEAYDKLQLKDSFVQAHLQAAVKRGAEGIVIKEMDGLYEFKKCRTWMKLKPYLEADMKIVGAEEECDKHGSPKNSLGALVVSGMINGKKIKTNVGGGYTRKQRIDFWKDHKKGKLIGKIIEMKHEGVTVNNAVRFPRFARLRWDKDKAGDNR